jgi:hypothetical protein
VSGCAGFDSDDVKSLGWRDRALSAFLTPSRAARHDSGRILSQGSCLLSIASSWASCMSLYEVSEIVPGLASFGLGEVQAVDPVRRQCWFSLAIGVC